MEGLSKFKKEIFRTCIVIACLAEAVSLLLHGFDKTFLMGIVLGTAVTIMNFNILVLSAEKMAQTKKKGPVVGGYFLRLPIYGAVFYLCLRISTAAAIACAVGFVSLHMSIAWLYGIRTLLPGAKKNPLNDWDKPKKWRDPSEWEDEDDEYKDL